MSTTRFPPPNPADDDYIRRGNLLNGTSLFYATRDKTLKTGPFVPGDWAISLETVYNVPAADVRPVVLCGVCKLHGHCGTEDVFAFFGLAEENRFCAVGKVKTNGDGEKREGRDGEKVIP